MTRHRLQRFGAFVLLPLISVVTACQGDFVLERRANNDVNALDDGAAAAGAGAAEIVDCDVESGYEVIRVEGEGAGSPEVFVLSVYETSSEHSFGNHPTGAALVRVERTAPLILALSAYEPTLWTIDAVEGAQIVEIILNGYHVQSLDAPAGVPVVNLSGAEEGGEPLSACGYGDDEGGCDTQSLVAGVEELTGQPITELVGCYHASSFLIGDGAGEQPGEQPGEEGEEEVIIDEEELEETEEGSEERVEECSAGGLAQLQSRAFERPGDELACDGEQLVAFHEGQGLFLGVQLCASSSAEFRLYMSVSEDGPFLPATDTAGHGQDHCELVNASFTIPDEDDITSGGCADCATGSNLPLEGVAVFNRSVAGECFALVEQTGEWSWQTSRLSCGVSLP